MNSIIRSFTNNLIDYSSENVFNPYADQCNDSDGPSAVEVRRSNLRIYLTAFQQQPPEIVIFGRDLGYRGGRRTGLALTDDRSIERCALLYGMSGLKRATEGRVVSESTAGIVWSFLESTGVRALLWNTFPFHPFEEGSPMSNRRHTREEFDKSSSLLRTLLRFARNAPIVALGNDAHADLLAAGILSSKVRHPSHGGANQFRSEMAWQCRHILCS